MGPASSEIIMAGSVKFKFGNDYKIWYLGGGLFQLFRPTGGFPAQSVLLDFGEVETVEEEIENATDSGASTKNAECRPGPEIGHHDAAGETAHSATFHNEF